MKILKQRCFIFAIALATMHTPAQAGSSAISKQLERVSRELVRDYEAKNPGKRDVSLAAFPFHSSKGLARRNVGFAVSELLLSHFVKSPTFGVVERSALTKVLQEQKLQVTGAVDPDTAVRVGKLIGAQVLLLGSVDKLGGKYHVNARLVDAESAKVVAVAYGELAAALFEEEAKPLLALTPKQQAIGIFLIYNYRRNSNNFPSASASDGFQTITTTPKSFSLSLVGFGIRYFPISSIAVDVLGGLVVNRDAVATKISCFSGSCSQPVSVIVEGSTFVKGMVSWVHSFNWRSRVYLGGGAAFYRFKYGNLPATDLSYATPVLRAGYEFKVQQRLAVSFFVNYDLLSKTGERELRPSGTVNEFRPGKFSFGPSIAAYF